MITPERRAAIIEYRKEKALGLLKEVEILLANNLANFRSKQDVL